jgi:hypothetical protein
VLDTKPPKYLEMAQGHISLSRRLREKKRNREGEPRVLAALRLQAWSWAGSLESTREALPHGNLEARVSA